MNARFDTEKGDDRILLQLKQILSELEGPPAPAAPARSTDERARHRRRVVLALTAVVAAAALAALLAVFLPGGNGSSEGCAARLVFQGRLYEAIGVSRGSFALAEELGQAIQPGCTDSITQSPSGVVTVEGSPDQPVAVNAIAGVDPRVAIARPDDPGGVYVVAGRCSNYGGGESAFFRCLRFPLTYGGRLYVETRLRTPSLRERFTLAERLGEAGMGERSVPVFRIEGVDPAVAVGRPGDKSRVYIADGKCMLTGLARLARCLRAL